MTEWTGFRLLVVVRGSPRCSRPPLLAAPASAAGVVRENYRGRVLPAALGLLIAVAALVALAPLAALDELADADTLAPELGTALVYVLGVAFLGFVDDLLGGRAPAGAGAEPSAPRGLARARAGRRARAAQHRAC